MKNVTHLNQSTNKLKRQVLYKFTVATEVHEVSEDYDIETEITPLSVSKTKLMKSRQLNFGRFLTKAML